MTAPNTQPDLTPAQMLVITRADLALMFETLTDPQVEQAGRAAILETGGTLVEPRGQWGPLEWEVTLYGVQGRGDSLAAALRTWAKRARRIHHAGGMEQAA
jgi:hypothetical protein